MMDGELSMAPVAGPEHAEVAPDAVVLSEAA